MRQSNNGKSAPRKIQRRLVTEWWADERKVLSRREDGTFEVHEWYPANVEALALLHHVVGEVLAEAMPAIDATVRESEGRE